MACYKPLKAWRAATGPLFFKQPEDVSRLWYRELTIPCGQCVGCLLERSRQWAARMMHEASLFDGNEFLTLTYAPEKLPADGSLHKEHFQGFMKRFRKRCGKVRYFHCGEYGERFKRPHYHAVFFGFVFPDRVFWKDCGDYKVYRSELLDDIWGHGECKLGSVSFESCAYVARYVVAKKFDNFAKVPFLSSISGFSGEVVSLQPEYVTMSRRPGIGFAWFRKFGNEVYPSDEIIVRGVSSRPPRYYDLQAELAEPSVFDAVKRRRISRFREEVASHDANGVWTSESRPERLRVREKCAVARLSLFKRPVE